MEMKIGNFSKVFHLSPYFFGFFTNVHISTKSTENLGIYKLNDKTNYIVIKTYAWRARDK